MNKKPRYNEVVVEIVDRVHGTVFPEIRPWRPLIANPVEIVDVLTGTDSHRHCPTSLVLFDDPTSRFPFDSLTYSACRSYSIH